MFIDYSHFLSLSFGACGSGKFSVSTINFQLPLNSKLSSLNFNNEVLAKARQLLSGVLSAHPTR